MNYSYKLHKMKFLWMLFFIAFITIITDINLLAQNLLITDYKVPVSSSQSFLIDVKGNYASVGNELTTNKSNIGGVYKRFYDSLPYAYSFDCVGSYSRNTGDNDYNLDLEGRIEKYIWKSHDLFGSIKFHSLYSEVYERPPLDVTIGLGFGRFVNVTPLAKAARIEGFLLREGLLYDDLPAETMIKFGQLIEREYEYRSSYGSPYKAYWYEDMTDLISESGMLKAEQVDAIGILRMDEVLFQQKVHDRFYGWDATLGTKIEILTGSEDIERKRPAADITVRYSRPISWRAQWNERFTANSPMNKEFMKTYDITLYSDFTYEITNRVDFTLNHHILIDKNEQDVDAVFTNSLRISFVFLVENSINFVTSMNFDKENKTPLKSSFSVALNYRVF